MNEDLSVREREQEDPVWCGAASAQMVLESLGAGQVPQHDLFGEIKEKSTSTDPADANWHSAPDGLTRTLNGRRPEDSGKTFRLFALSREERASQKLVWTIHHYGVAPIALVYGDLHWVVVRGYDASAAPQSANDTSYVIQALEINNPWNCEWGPPAGGPADACGIEHISYEAWQTDYMNGPVSTGEWDRKYVVICDPEPPPDTPLPLWVRPPIPVGALISPAEAVARAQGGIGQFGLFDRDPWRPPHPGTQFGFPILVQYLDRPDGYYYLVPIGSHGGVVPLGVRIDARSGSYLGAAKVPVGGPHAYPGLDRDAVLARIVGREIDLGIDGLSVPVRPDVHSLYPNLVWKPCLESLSPFYPFYMFNVGTLNFFVRIDGKVFGKLHDQVRGI